MIIPLTILTLGLFINNIKVQDSLSQENYLVPEIKTILKHFITKKSYGTYPIKKSFSKDKILTIIKNYVYIKNVIILEEKIIIYSHNYVVKGKKYNDKLIFQMENHQLKSIIYKRCPSLTVTLPSYKILGPKVAYK